MPEFRRLALFLTIGSFSLAALLGVLALLSGGDFGEGEARVLLTTLCVGITSVLSLCYLATADTAYRLVGVLGALAGLPTLAVSLLLTWTDVWDDGNDAIWQAFGIGSVASVTLAQAALLLVVTPRAPSYVRTMLAGTLLAMAWVAAHVSLLILDADIGGDSWRVLGIVAILDVLGTVAVSALARFGGARRSTPAGLEVPRDLVPFVLSRAASSGRTPEAVLREAVLAGLEGRGASSPDQVRST
jgi:hypothetical protein